MRVRFSPRGSRSVGSDINFCCHLINSEFSSEIPYLNSCFHCLCIQHRKINTPPHAIKGFLKFSVLYINIFQIERNENDNNDFSLGQSLLFFPTKCTYCVKYVYLSPGTSYVFRCLLHHLQAENCVT
jgi:hypothetical protein